MCASVLRPEEAALLAGVVANPSGYDPVAHPVAAERRRNLVLQRMLEQGRLPALQYFNARQEALPGRVPSRRPSDRRRRTSRPGSASSSSTASARAAPSRAG